MALIIAELCGLAVSLPVPSYQMMTPRTDSFKLVVMQKVCRYSFSWGIMIPVLAAACRDLSERIKTIADQVRSESQGPVGRDLPARSCTALT